MKITNCEKFLRPPVLPRLLAAIFLSALSAQAQESPPTAPPSAPFVASPPPGSRWMADIRTESAAASRVTPTRLEMEIGTDGRQRGTLTFSDNSAQTFYAINGVVLQELPGSDSVVIVPPASPDGGDPGLVAPGFPGVHWLSEQTYRGVDQLGEVACHKFEFTNPESEDPADHSVNTAWIRIEDGYPVRTQRDGVIYDFHPIVAYPDAVVFPPAVEQKLHAIRAQSDALERLRMRNALPR